MHFGKRKFKADKSLPKKIVEAEVELLTPEDVKDVEYSFAEINDIGITINVQNNNNKCIDIILDNKSIGDFNKGIEGNHTKFNGDEFIEILKFALPYLEESCGLTIKNIVIKNAHSIDTYVNPSVITIKSLSEYIHRIKNIKYIYKVIIRLHKLKK